MTGVGLAIFGNIVVLGFAAGIVFALGHRAGFVSKREGVGLLARSKGNKRDNGEVQPKVKLIPCPVCHVPHSRIEHDDETHTCGKPECVNMVWKGRLRMAEARAATDQTRLEPVQIQGERGNGSPMFTRDGEPVMVRHSSGYWVRTSGGPADAADRAAIAWAEDQRRR